jgi:hypothetical protein
MEEELILFAMGEIRNYLKARPDCRYAGRHTQLVDTLAGYRRILNNHRRTATT